MKYNSRELFQRIMHFEPVDRMFIFELEAYSSETMPRWRKEGLPEDVDIKDYLGMDRVEWAKLDFFPRPRFETKFVEEDERFLTEWNEMGIKTKYMKSCPGIIYSYLEHPVKNRADWARIKDRFNATDPGRYPENWDPEVIKYYKEAEHPIGILLHPFLFRHAYYLMGMERFMMMFYEDPKLMHEMFSFFADYTIKALGPMLEQTKIDFVVLAEDLAYCHSTHISPQVYTEFWMPYQPKVIDYIKSTGIDIVAIWSSGNTKPLMHLFLEAGFNTFWPIEDVAGMDAREMRQQYGQKIRLVGNIAKEALIKGKEAIKKEVYAKVPELFKQGGYIPTVDDEIPYEVPFEYYVYYIQLLKSLKI